MYSYDSEAMLERQSKLKASIQKVVPAPKPAQVLYMVHTPSSLMIRVRDDFTMSCNAN